MKETLVLHKSRIIVPWHFHHSSDDTLRATHNTGPEHRTSLTLGRTLCLRNRRISLGMITSKSLIKILQDCRSRSRSGTAAASTGTSSGAVGGVDVAPHAVTFLESGARHRPPRRLHATHRGPGTITPSTRSILDRCLTRPQQILPINIASRRILR